MNSLNLEAFGFDLLPVETIDGSEVFSLITPFVLLDDEKLDIFVEKVGKFIHFFDEGSLIFSLHGHGFSMSSLENYSPWTKLKKHLSAYDVIFEEGQIEHWCEIEKGATALTSTLGIIDDSIDVRRAQREINILGPVTPVMPLSRLKINALQPSLG